MHVTPSLAKQGTKAIFSGRQFIGCCVSSLNIGDAQQKCAGKRLVQKIADITDGKVIITASKKKLLISGLVRFSLRKSEIGRKWP